MRWLFGLAMALLSSAAAQVYSGKPFTVLEALGGDQRVAYADGTREYWTASGALRLGVWCKAGEVRGLYLQGLTLASGKLPVTLERASVYRSDKLSWSVRARKDGVLMVSNREKVLEALRDARTLTLEAGAQRATFGLGRLPGALEQMGCGLR